MTAIKPDDLVGDILDRVAMRFGEIPRAVGIQIEKEIRADWGGETHYIAKHGESARVERLDRDARIRRDFRRGEHPEFLSRRYGIGIKRIRQIVAEGNGLP